MADGIPVGGMFVNIGANIKGLLAGLSGAEQATSAFAGKMSALGTKLTKFVTLPLLAIGGASVAAFANFEDAMTKSMAIMGDLSDDMKQKMSDAAREVAKTTTFSATQAAESYYYLASAGMDAATAIEALPKVAKFAQAGNFDMALATDILTDAQSGLGMVTKDVTKDMENMVRISDVLVRATSLANATTQQFGEALINKLGPWLSSVNKDVEEGVAVLAAMADRGLKGAEAGEALSRAMVELTDKANVNAKAFKDANIAVFDSEGNLRHLGDIIGDVSKAYEGLSDSQAAQLDKELGLQKRASDTFRLLRDTEDAIKDYETSLRSAGGATDEVSEKQLESATAQWELFKSGIVDVGIDIGEKLTPALLDLLPSLEGLGNVLAGVVSFFADLPTWMQGVVIAVGPVLKAFSLVKAHPLIAGGMAAAAGIMYIIDQLTDLSGTANKTRKHLDTILEWGKNLLSNLPQYEYAIDTVEGALERLGYETTLGVLRMQGALEDIVVAGQNAAANLEPLPVLVAGAFNQAVPEFKQAGTNAILGYIASIAEQTGMGRNQAEQFANEVFLGLTSKDADVRNAAQGTFDDLLQILIDAKVLSGDVAADMSVALRDGLESQYRDIKSNFASALDSLLIRLADTGSMTEEKARGLSSNLKEAMKSHDPEIRANAEKLWSDWLASQVNAGVMSIEQAEYWMSEFKDALTLTDGDVQSMVRPVEQFGSDSLSALEDAVTKLRRMWGGFRSYLSENITTGNVSVRGPTPMQHGGIVTRPTLALIGEAGPEAVVPLTGPHAGAAGLTVSGGVYHFHGVQDVAGFEAALRSTAQKSQLRGAVLP